MQALCFTLSMKAKTSIIRIELAKTFLRDVDCVATATLLHTTITITTTTTTTIIEAGDEEDKKEKIRTVVKKGKLIKVVIPVQSFPSKPSRQTQR